MIKANLEKPEKLKDFNKLKARVYINAKDAETEMTMSSTREASRCTVQGGQTGHRHYNRRSDPARSRQHQHQVRDALVFRRDRHGGGEEVAQT